MKYLTFVMVALIAFNLNAQEQRRGDKDKYSPEQIATLRTNRLALDLDLTEAQKKEVYKLHLKNAKKRQNKLDTRKKGEGKRFKDLSAEERFNKENGRLENQIANKKEMKRILNKDQFEKWETNHKKRNYNKKGFKSHKGKKYKANQGKRGNRNFRPEGKKQKFG